MNFLTALGVMYEGVREILPFVRYLSQFVDFEIKTIKAQDHGKGVVCAATWYATQTFLPYTTNFPHTHPQDHACCYGSTPLGLS
jgi:hypothetical protein